MSTTIIRTEGNHFRHGREVHVSKYYNLLVARSTETVDQINAWKMDKSDDISEEDHNEACLKAHKQSISIFFKICTV